jgi:hypothetical protein
LNRAVSCGLGGVNTEKASKVGKGKRIGVSQMSEAKNKKHEHNAEKERKTEGGGYFSDANRKERAQNGARQQKAISTTPLPPPSTGEVQ